MPDFLTRDDLLACLTNTHEKILTPELFGNRPILIREITARQRFLAQQAAQTDDPDAPDEALYRAMMIQMAVVDPDSGTPGPDGRIDPRTRTPLLTIADVESLANGRDVASREVFSEIAALAGLLPAALFRRHPVTDGPQRGAGEGAATGGATNGETEDPGTGGADERTSVHRRSARKSRSKPGTVE